MIAGLLEACRKRAYSNEHRHHEIQAGMLWKFLVDLPIENHPRRIPKNEMAYTAQVKFRGLTDREERASCSCETILEHWVDSLAMGR